MFHHGSSKCPTVLLPGKRRFSWLRSLNGCGFHVLDKRNQASPQKEDGLLDSAPRAMKIVPWFRPKSDIDTTRTLSVLSMMCSSDSRSWAEPDFFVLFWGFWLEQARKQQASLLQVCHGKYVTGWFSLGGIGCVQVRYTYYNMIEAETRKSLPNSRLSTRNI